MDTWSSWLAEVGMLSTEFGKAKALFSLQSAAAVTCAIMKPEFTPPFFTKNGGNCDMCLSIIIEMRRSDMEPISAIAKAMLSAAIATGSAWKLPPDNTSPESANTKGLSDTALASISKTTAAWRNWVKAAPITCGWQRRQYGSCTLPHSACDKPTSLSSPSKWRYTPAASI